MFAQKYKMLRMLDKYGLPRQIQTITVDSYHSFVSVVHSILFFVWKKDYANGLPTQSIMKRKRCEG